MQSLNDNLHDKCKKQKFKRAEAILGLEHVEMKNTVKCYENFNFLELNSEQKIYIDISIYIFLQTTNV